MKDDSSVSSSKVGAHTPEPWHAYKPANQDWAIVDDNGTTHATVMSSDHRKDEPNAHRIAACVNYCKGKTLEQLEDGDEGYPGIAHDFELIRLQNIQLSQALRGYVLAMDSGNPVLLEHADKMARAALAKLDIAS